MPIEKLGTYMLKKIIRKKFFIFVFSLFITINLFPEAKQLILGGKQGWDSFLNQENIAVGKGRFGYDSIEISTNAFKFDDYTDLLINFENEKIDVQGNYVIRQNQLKKTDLSVMGKGAGLSRDKGGLVIHGEKGSFFGNEGFAGSFSIEFWLSPSLSENGEIVLNWRTSRIINRQLVYQMINGTFVGGHIEWTFTNLFDLYDGSDADVKLTGRSTVIPDSWSYHVISYDCETGIFEYLVNGVTEDIKYITATGNDDGIASLVVLGKASELEICPDFVGKLDDFRILKRPYSPPDFQSAEMAGPLQYMSYAPQGGYFETKPIMLSNGSMINSIDTIMNVPEQTSIEYFVRSGDNYYNWTSEYPEWKSFESGKSLFGITGMYFQILAVLYPDGNGHTTPSITQITINYSELDPPLPPHSVRATAGNGCVTLNWSYSVDDTAGGYYIYYGNRPGEYLGRFAVEGDSPIQVGNVTTLTITGLENGRIYYFAVAACSSFDERVIGPLSREVYARPLARLER